MPFKEATFWYGTILFTTGIYFWIIGGDRVTVGIILTVIGLVMSVYAVIAEHYPSLPKMQVWVALLLLTWAALGYDYYDRHANGAPVSIFGRTPLHYVPFLLLAMAGVAWIAATIAKTNQSPSTVSAVQRLTDETLRPELPATS